MKELLLKPLPKVVSIITLAVIGFSTAGLGTYQYMVSKDIDKMEQVTAQMVNAEMETEQETEKSKTQNKNQIENQNALKFGTATCPTTLTENEISAEVADWKKVENTKYNFSYYIPKGWEEYSPPEAEGVPEERWFRDDEDYSNGFMYMEYTADWKAGGVYQAYKEIGKETLKVACTNGTLYTKKADGENFYLLEADFYPNGNHHRIFYFYKSLGGASLDSDFGEQFKLILKTIQFN